MTAEIVKWTGQCLVAPAVACFSSVQPPCRCHALSSVLHLLSSALLFLSLLERWVSRCLVPPGYPGRAGVDEKVKPGNTSVKGFGVLILPSVCHDKIRRLRPKDKVHYFFRGLIFSILTKSGFFLRFFRTRFHIASKFCRWELV